jgi:hypothetical protein
LRSEIVVLDRGADSAGLGDSGDRQRGALRIGAVTVLEVDRDRKIGRPVEQRSVLDDLVQGDATVETLLADGSDEALGDRVRFGRPHRRLDGPDPSLRKTSSKGPLYLLSRSRIRKRSAAQRS